MVRGTRLELAWYNHTPLKRARLPIPPSSHDHAATRCRMKYSITDRQEKSISFCAFSVFCFCVFVCFFSVRDTFCFKLYFPGGAVRRNAIKGSGTAESKAKASKRCSRPAGIGKLSASAYCRHRQTVGIRKLPASAKCRYPQAAGISKYAPCFRGYHSGARRSPRRQASALL